MYTQPLIEHIDEQNAGQSLYFFKDGPPVKKSLIRAIQGPYSVAIFFILTIS